MATCCFCKQTLPEYQTILAQAKPIDNKIEIDIWEASACSPNHMMMWMMKNYFNDVRITCYQQILEDHEIEYSLDSLILARDVLKFLEIALEVDKGPKKES